MSETFEVYLVPESEAKKLEGQYFEKQCKLYKGCGVVLIKCEELDEVFQHRHRDIGS